MSKEPKITKKSINKQAHILKCAKKVFSKKGYAAVTMQDLVDNAGISRGGLYRYFSSVEEIYLLLMDAEKSNEAEKLTNIYKDELSFDELFENYLAETKAEALNIKTSFTLATFDYFIALRNEKGSGISRKRFTANINMINEILAYGEKNNILVFKNSEKEILSSHILMLLEGLLIFSISNSSTSESIDAQFDIIRKLVNSYKK